VGGHRRAACLFFCLLLCSCLLALAGCGGGGEGDSSVSTTASTPKSQAKAPDAGETTAEPQGASGPKESGSSKAPEPKSTFTPKPHQDSGGGSDQFKVKGGDNSVQEFGEEAPESELEQAATALHGFLDARAAGDWEAACSYLSAPVAESLEQLAANAKPLKGADCAELLQGLSGGVPASVLAEAAKADVGSLRFEGEQAFLIYRGAHDAVYAIAMAEEGGEWKVAGMSGTPLG
jgi:hypothetical protein